VKDFEVLYEDNAIIVANKISALPVQKEKSGDPNLQDLLAEAEEARSGKPPEFLEAVHRIDRRASGIVLLAKSKKAAATLSDAFRDGLVKKTYLAVVDSEPTPAGGRLEHDIAWDQRNAKARIRGGSADKEQKPVKGGARDAVLEYKKSALSYRVAAKSERYVLLEIGLETGRPHQIRAQLAAIGLPVRGDLKYGARRSTKNGMIMLHDWRVEFVHPESGKALSFVALPPATDNLWNGFGDLSANGELAAKGGNRGD
jgi:23S rRNA pseudouridine1911/1915/1917 synthase